RYLGVETGPQLAPHRALDVLHGRPFRQFQRRQGLLADRIGILPGDPEQVAVDEHRVTATQRLGDVAGTADRKRYRVTLRDKDGGTVALETDRFTAAGIHHSLGAGGRK